MSDLREALEAAYEKHVEEEPEGQELTPGTEAGGSSQDSAQPLGDSSTETPESGSDTPSLADGTAKTTGSKPGTDNAVQKQRTDQSNDDNRASQNNRAPGSWKPAIREHWSKIPSVVQQEIMRRETEINRGLASAAESRRFTEEFNSVVRPFEGIIRSQNSTPIAAVRNLMTTAAGMTMGTPIQKANIAAEILQNYGVDIELLDQVLSGKQPKPGSPSHDPGIRDMIQREMAPVRQFMTENQQRVQQQEQQLEYIAEEAVEDASYGKEFFDDLAEDMADILEHSAARNRKMTIDQAYDLAARSHPDIAPLYSQKMQAVQANQGNGRAARARNASSSVKPGGPAGGGVASPTDLRGAISAAYEKHTRG